MCWSQACTEHTAQQALARFCASAVRVSYEAISYWDFDVDKALRLQDSQASLTEMQAQRIARKAERVKLAKDKHLLAKCKWEYGVAR